MRLVKELNEITEAIKKNLTKADRTLMVRVLKERVIQLGNHIEQHYLDRCQDEKREIRRCRKIMRVLSKED